MQRQKKEGRLKIKGIICLIPFLIGVFCSGCYSNQPMEGSGKLRIVTTIFPAYDFAREIVGDTADISMLLPPGTESHSFEPSPADMIAVENCDLFIYNGGESDAWVDTLLENKGTSNYRVLRMMECVDVVEEKSIEGIDEIHQHGGEGMTAEYDEHVWTAPQNAIKITKAIAMAMMDLDPIHSQTYQENLFRYSKELEDLDGEFREIVASASRTTMIFGDRFPFRYFAEAYRLDYRAAFPGCSSETEPSVKTVAYLVDKIRKEKIPNVFYIEFSNQKIAKMLQVETGAVPLLFHSCHNLSKEEMERGDTYLSLMRLNAENLKEALSDDADHM